MDVGVKKCRRRLENLSGAAASLGMIARGWGLQHRISRHRFVTLVLQDSTQLIDFPRGRNQAVRRPLSAALGDYKFRGLNAGLSGRNGRSMRHF
jgi:hypothetical protein